MDQQITADTGPINLSVSIPRDKLNAMVAMLKDKPGEFNRIMSQSINDAIRAGRTEVGRLVRSSLNMPVEDSKKAVKPIWANRTRPWGELRVTRAAMSLKSYRPKRVGRGVRVSIRKGQPEIIEGAFLRDFFRGHVFQRTSIYNRRKGLAAVKDFRKLSKNKKHKSALHVTKLHGPTLVGLIANKPGALEKIRTEMADRVVNRFTSKANYLLTRKTLPNESATA